MTRKIEMGDLFEPVEIGLWGQYYEVLLATKQIEGKVGPALAALVSSEGDKPEGAEDATEDEMLVYSDADRQKKAELFADAVDAVLKPIDSEDDEGVTKKAPRAKAHLLKLYKGNDLGIVHLEAAFEQVYEAYQGRNRPTQSSPEPSATTSE